MTLGGRASIGIALSALAAGGLWAPAAQASAGQDAVITQVVTQTVNDGQVAEAAMNCGPSARAIAGGVAGDSQFPPTLIAANGPLGSGGTTAGTNDFDVPRYWYAAVTNLAAAPQTYTFYAVCSATADATVQTDSFTVPGTSQAVEGGTVGCPPGQRAIGGGFSTPDAPLPGVGMFISQPLDSSGIPDNTTTGDVAAGWLAEGRNETTTAGHFKVIAICSPSSAATVAESEFSTNDYKPAHATTCPAGARATGVGFGSVGGLFGQLFGLAPSDAAGAATLNVGGVPRGAFARVDSVPFGAHGYRTYAMCEAETMAAPPGSGLTGRRAAALKKCKKKHSHKARKRCKKKAARLPV